MNSDRKRLLKEAKRLIRFHSVTTESNGAIARHIGKLLKREKFKVHYQTERINGIPFSNVIGLKGKGRCPLILMTHLDTVPPGPRHLWTETRKDPWNPRKRGDRIYGLGSADTKLDILAKIFASRNIPARLMKRPLMIVGTFGEESGLLGARTFCKKMRHLGGYAFVSEPTELTWVHAHRGYLVLEVTLPLKASSRRGPVSRCLAPESIFELEAKGKSAHSSTPERGRNAIRLAFDFLEKISHQDPALKLLSVEGGFSPNQVPSEARLVFATALRKLPHRSFVKTRRLKEGVVKRKRGARRPEMGAGSGAVPWKALVGLFEAIDNGIQRRKRPMVSTVGVIKREGRFLRVYVDFRIHPRDRNEEILTFFQRRMERVLRRHRLRGQFRIEREGPPLSVSPKSPIVQLARLASRRTNLPFRLTRKPSCTEAGYLWGKEIPALVVGPGKSLGNIHAPNEYNELRQLEKAQRLYEVLIQRYCVGH